MTIVPEPHLILAPEVEKLWESRLYAVLTMIEVAQARTGAASDGLEATDLLDLHTKRLVWLIEILERLKVFANAHFGYLAGKIRDQGLRAPTRDELSAHRRQRRSNVVGMSSAAPPAHVPMANLILDNILNRVATDLFLIETAVNQRVATLATTPAGTPAYALPANAESFYTTSTPTQRLELMSHWQASADILAMGALAMLSEKLYVVQKSAVITYTDPGASARILPYAPIALVGVPATSLYRPRDLLAIPHEVGHYFFWNGMTSSGNTIEATANQALANNPLLHWAEEVFADVVGCLVGGPAAAESLLDMLWSQVGSRFTQDDGEHPVPAVRPDIYLRLLERGDLWADTADDMAAAAVALRAEWQRRLRLILDDEADSTSIVLGDVLMTLGELRTALNALVDGLLETIPSDSPVRGKGGPAKQQMRWSHARSTPQKQFETDLPTLVATLDQQLAVYAKDPDLTSPYNYELQVARDLFDENLSWTATIKEPANWLRLVEYRGWSTFGPVGKPHD